MKKFATLSLSILLAACGGGGGGGSTTSTTDPVTTASAATAQQLGLAAIPGGSAGETGYNLVADIGDSWRLFLDETNKTFRLFIVSSQYGLNNPNSTTPILAGNYTVNYDGSYTFAPTSGAGGGSIKVDKRTMSLVGSITIGSATAPVSGSGYAPPSNFDFSKLNGTYVYGGKTRSAPNLNLTYSPSVGTYNISGTSVTVCPNAYHTASGCSNGTPLALTASWDATVGAIRLKEGANDYGIVQVQAGDRGAVMLIDVASTSTSTFGAYYGIKTSRLNGTEGNGTWKRAYGSATANVSGTSVTATENGATASWTLTYNETLINNTPAPYDGFFRGAPNVSGVGLPFAGVPLSSSVILIGDTSGFSVWSRQ